jgi:hypothetical protein
MLSGRKLTRSNLRGYHHFCLEELARTTQSLRKSGSQDRVLILGLPNAKEECNTLDSDIRVCMIENIFSQNVVKAPRS